MDSLMNCGAECAPVLMLGFNRPELTRALLGCVRSARPARLYFAVDGARLDRPGEPEQVEAVRQIAQEVDWPCEVRTWFRKQNRGCAHAIPEAISWFLGQESAGIILEDDVRPSPDFFPFATELLERYRDDGRMGMISGFNLYGFQSDRRASYHFTRHCNIWGWATWARVWKDYSLDIRQYLPQLETILMRNLPSVRMRRMMRGYIHGVVEQPDTWDFQFSLLLMAKGYLAVEPARRLTVNVGFGAVDAVHTGGYSYDAMEFARVERLGEMRHPAQVAADDEADLLTEERMCGLLPRALTVAGLAFPRLRSLITRLGQALESVLPVIFRW